MTNSLIQAGDRELIADSDVVLLLNDKIEQGTRKMYIVSNEPIEPAGVVLVYRRQLARRRFVVYQFRFRVVWSFYYLVRHWARPKIIICIYLLLLAY